MVKNISCVGSAAWNGFPINSLLWAYCPNIYTVFEGVQYLAGQNYKMCIRAEQGACFVGFQADPNHFMLQVSYV